MPLVSGGVPFRSGDTVGPDLFPGKPGCPAPLFCAKAADPSRIVERATAAIVFVRMASPMLFEEERRVARKVPRDFLCATGAQAPCCAALLPASRAARCAPARSLLTSRQQNGGRTMAWTTPTLVEICIGLEINGYLPAEF